MNKKQKKAQKADLKLEAELLDAIAISVATIERMDDDHSDDKRHRNYLKKRKDKGEPYDKPKLKKLNAEIRADRDKLEVVRARLEKRKGWLAKTRDRIVNRRKIGKKPRIINLRLDFRPMDTQTTVDKVIGHYTAGPVDQNTKDAIRLCKIYHAAHLAKGWSGEAYMICFTSDGNILLLRPAKWVGAHTLGYNTGSYGVVCHGTTGDNATGKQKQAMQWWAKNGHKKLMGPAQTQKRPSAYPWKGHNEYNATACPGDFIDTYHNKGE